MVDTAAEGPSDSPSCSTAEGSKALPTALVSFLGYFIAANMVVVQLAALLWPTFPGLPPLIAPGSLTGLTSIAFFRVDSYNPLAGVEAAASPGGRCVDLHQDLQRRVAIDRVEPEVAYLIGRDLEGPVTPAQALLAVDGVCCALELIDSRYQNFQFTLEDVVADNASSSRFVLGSMVKPRDFDAGNLGMVMEKNGIVAEMGSSAAIYDHPARSLAALANQLAALGEGLKAGMIVMTGGATAAITLDSGDHVRVLVDGLGSCEFSVR